MSSLRVDPAPYLATARVLLVTAQGCGWEATLAHIKALIDLAASLRGGVSLRDNLLTVRD